MFTPFLKEFRTFQWSFNNFCSDSPTNSYRNYSRIYALSPLREFSKKFFSKSLQRVVMCFKNSFRIFFSENFCRFMEFSPTTAFRNCTRNSSKKFLNRGTFSSFWKLFRNFYRNLFRDFLWIPPKLLAAISATILAELFQVFLQEFF